MQAWGRATRVLMAAGLLAQAVISFGASPAHAQEGSTPSKIVFSDNIDGQNDIYTINADGTGLTQLTTDTGAINNSAAGWGPGQSKVLYSSDSAGYTEIWRMNPDGTNKTRLTPVLDNDGWADWSPDGSKIAFFSDRSPGFPGDIWVMNADGTGAMRLTTAANVDHHPDWSPDGSKIVFRSNRDGNTEIYSMNADGTGQTRLTTNTAIDSTPQWSPDGSKIAFWSNRDGNFEIYTMNANGTGQTRLTNVAGSDRDPVWSPDGQQIAFTTSRNGNGEIYRMNADGTNQTLVFSGAGLSTKGDLDWFSTGTADNTPPESPTFTATNPVSPSTSNTPKVRGSAEAGSTVRLYTNSTCTSAVAATGTASDFAGTGLTVTVTDGSTTTFYATATDTVGNSSGCSSSSITYQDRVATGDITFTSDKGGFPYDIFTMKADGSNMTQLTFETGGNISYESTYSPDGSKILWTRHNASTGESDLWTMNADGSGKTNITNTGGTVREHGPDWSPDGSKIAFFNYGNDVNDDIWVMNTDGTGRTRLTTHAETDHNPEWSPDGSRIVFASFRDGGEEIWIMNADGTNQTQLTFTPSNGGNSFPSWSPDGTKIVYHSYVDGDSDLYTMNPNGTGVTNITNNAQADLMPSWMPGNKITFSSSRTGTQEVFEINADGTGAVQLTNDAGLEYWAERAGQSSTDTTPPNTTIDSGPSGTIAVNSATFQFSSDDPAATYQCSIDGTPFALGACTSPRGYSSLSEGVHTFQVRATDESGNTDATPASRTFTVDTTGPGAPNIDSGPAGATAVNDVTVQFSSAESGQSYECRLDGGTYAPCTSPASFNDLPDGSHTIEIRGTDAVGNVGSPAVLNFTVDTTAPDTTITSGPSGTITTNSTSFEFSSDDPTATFECRLDSGSWTSCSSASQLTNLSQGAHLYEIRATDSLGNKEANPASRSFTVDTVAPGRPTIDEGPGATVTTQFVTIEFSATDPDVTFECRLDGVTFTVCSSPTTFDNLDEGEHTIEVRSVDAAGNPGTPVVMNFLVDRTAPDTTIDSGPAGTIAQTTADFHFSSDASDAAFECKLDNGSWFHCTSPQNLIDLDQGSHTFEVRSFDNAGNVDLSPATRTFSVDTDGPDAPSIEQGPSGTVNSTSVTLEFSSDEPGATFECKLDSGSFVACASPATFDGLAEGAHTIEVRALDPNGTPGVPVTLSFTVDTVFPDTTIDSGPSGTVGTDSAVFTFSSDDDAATFECSLDGSPFALGTCSSPHGYTNLAEGTHAFEVRATDAAGQVDPTPATRSFEVDTTGPQEPEIDAGPGGTVTTDSITIEFSSTEPGVTFECKLDSGAFVACTSPATFDNLPDGDHTVEVRAVDPAGNPGTPVTIDFTIDTSTPGTTITSGPTGTITSDEAKFKFDSDDAHATFECRLDSRPWETCASPESVTDLADGDHLFEVRAVDAAGNVDPTPGSQSFSVDTTAPQTSIDAAPTGTIRTDSASFAFSADDSEATFECRLDPGPWEICASPVTFDDLSEGIHSFEVRALDGAGNHDQSPATATFSVDTIAPGTTITSAPSGTIVTDTADIEFTSDDPTAAFECRLDSSSWQACTSPESLSDLSDGTHDFEVRAVDSAGNADPTPSIRSFSVDTVWPGTSIDSGPTGTITTNSATFTFSADELGATFECSLDGSAFAFGACSSPHGYTGLAEGVHTFEVRAIDGAGQIDPSPAKRTFTVDTVAPETSIDAGPSGTIAANSALLSFSSPDDAATFECRLDSASWEDCASPHLVDNMSEGNHLFEVRATDAAGNQDESPAASAFTVDTTAPGTTITSGPQGKVTSNSVELTFTSDDTGANFECRLDDGSFQPCSSPLTVSDLTEGNHTFQVRAVDAAGNMDATPGGRNFEVDTIAPETTIDSAPTGMVTVASVDVRFSSDDSSATFECKLDNGNWNSCGSPKTFSDLAEGDHDVLVRATDSAGNVDQSPATAAFTVDTAAPGTTITSGSSGWITSDAASFDFTSDDPTATFECKLDSGSWTTCSSPEIVSGLAEGDHDFQVRAVDEAGNEDPTPGSRAFSVDTIAPGTTITSGPSGTITRDSVDFSFTSDDDSAEFECRVDSGGWSPCNSPKTIEGLTDGNHVFEVRATDAAGNFDQTPGSRDFSVDLARPDTFLDSGPSGNIVVDNATFEFSSDDPAASFECSLDSESWVSCSSPNTYTALGEGPHDFRVRAVDPAGNHDDTPAGRTFSVDASVPDTAIDSGPSGTTRSASPTFAFSSDDATATFECRLDSGAWGTCNSPAELTDLTDGPHVFEVRAGDSSGNVDQTPAVRDYTIDTVAPGTTITSGPFGTMTAHDVAFTFTSDDDSATYECRLDSGSWRSCSSPEAENNVPDGSHVFEVRAVDGAGNVDETPASGSFSVDTTPPGTTITAGPSSEIASSSTEFSFTSNDPSAIFECRLDQQTWGYCAAPVSISGLSDGTHVFEVRAMDEVGHVDPTPGSRSFTVDTVAPDTSIDSGPVGTITTDVANFEFSSDDSSASFECSLDSNGWGDCSSPLSAEALTDGPHTLEVRAIDTAGNVDLSPAGSVFTVDTTAPETSIDSGPTGTIATNSTSVAFSADDAAASFECRLDAGAWASCTNPVTLASLTDGGHRFRVRAVDPVGNVDATPSVLVFAVDTSTDTEPDPDPDPDPDPNPNPDPDPDPNPNPDPKPDPDQDPRPDPDPDPQPEPQPTLDPEPTLDPGPVFVPPDPIEAPVEPGLPETASDEGPEPDRSKNDKNKAEGAKDDDGGEGQKGEERVKKAQLLVAEADEKEKEMGKWLRVIGKAVVYMAFPLILLLAVLVYLVTQYLIDRKDPKLAVAPVNAKYDLVLFE